MTAYYGQANQAAQTIINAFEQNNLPAALSQIFVHRTDDKPCDHWSWSNQLIAAFKGSGDARGFKQWKRAGRNVIRGEKAFPILAPITKTWTDDDGEKKCRLVGFKAIPVFGVHQTEGAPLPDSDPAETERLASLPLRDVAKAWDLNVTSYNGKDTGAAGYYQHGGTNKEIALGVENLSTWAHELVHAAEDRLGSLSKTTGQDGANELVAELGGCVLLEILGYEHDADRGGAWQYISKYYPTDTAKAAMRLINRVCSAVELILDAAATK